MERQLYIIAGCNGAGKTTAAYSLLPNVLHVNEFVNADEIARGLSPFNPESMAITAGKLMLQRIDELIACGTTFAIETTLATRSYTNLVKLARSHGYSVHILFFYLRNVNLAKQRVAERVEHGGHDIPIDVIERRYHAGLRNLHNLFMNEVDSWVIYDNSKRRRTEIASGGRSIPTAVYDEAIYKIIINHE